MASADSPTTPKAGGAGGGRRKRRERAISLLLADGEDGQPGASPSSRSAASDQSPHGSPLQMAAAEAEVFAAEITRFKRQKEARLASLAAKQVLGSMTGLAPTKEDVQTAAAVKVDAKAKVDTEAETGVETDKAVERRMLGFFELKNTVFALLTEAGECSFTRLHDLILTNLPDAALTLDGLVNFLRDNVMMFEMSAANSSVRLRDLTPTAASVQARLRNLHTRSLAAEQMQARLAHKLNVLAQRRSQIAQLRALAEQWQECLRTQGFDPAAVLSSAAAARSPVPHVRRPQPHSPHPVMASPHSSPSALRAMPYSPHSPHSPHRRVHPMPHLPPPHSPQYAPAYPPHPHPHSRPQGTAPPHSPSRRPRHAVPLT
ncbi:uncharacterized protein AMSG_04285 [Thecamonas trahens ATCC 50062]|uniref:Uncharacterized protein n=1 Tax=Thecamonas trahens ATCC 50062 TaxID=461836 RepID=A0A0L0D6P8_THETB|nr:hypothetical protein AMSG_04285 [Thecamonas trahens ATCC 50062]KNC48052.1 hypothetical protein AMSG_04285 [Thecamonas trahens ATCC 50062]|eukprot:XP_013759067.1 hypothetical protein AMSG_04285 [Thecamonas trahens ATCC 50062]